MSSLLAPPDRPLVGAPCMLPGGLLPRLRHTPFAPSAKQTAFLMTTCKEMLFGGAGGGGKSIALLMAALQFVDVPDYNALILRRKLTDLKLADGLISVSRKWLEGTGPTYNANDFTWTFPSGAVLQFGYMAQPGSEERYKSSQYQFIGFDEVTEFPWENQYTYLFSRLRKGVGNHEPAPDGLTLDHVPLRMRGATNPGGPGTTWVKARFVDPETASRPFMPAFLTDNPGLNADEYRESLSELDEVQRQRMEDGNWDVNEIPGALWRFDEIGRSPWVPPPVAPGGKASDVNALPPASTVGVRAIGLDPTVSEATKKSDEAGIVMGSLTDGVVTIERDFSGRMHPDDWARVAVLQYHAYGCSRIVVEDNQGGELCVSQLGNMADILGVDRPRVVKVKAVESKEARAAKVHTAYPAGKVVHSLELRSGSLEAQLTSWVPGSGDASPDRLDAAVWLVRNLLFGDGDQATYRTPRSVRDRMSGRMP